MSIVAGVESGIVGTDTEVEAMDMLLLRDDETGPQTGTVDGGTLVEGTEVSVETSEDGRHPVPSLLSGVVKNTIGSE
jgi:hypothetical protein